MNEQDVARLLRVRKAPEVECPHCSGFVTFGLGPMDGPLCWHSKSWCRSFRRVPNTPEGVVRLYERLARERPELRGLRVAP